MGAKLPPYRHRGGYEPRSNDPAPVTPPPKPGDMHRAPLYKKGDLPGNPDRWTHFRKKTLTRAIRIKGAFEVETIHSGRVMCEDGWLAVDNQGHPYPVDATEFQTIYEPVEET